MHYQKLPIIPGRICLDTGSTADAGEIERGEGEDEKWPMGGTLKKRYRMGRP